MHLLLIRHATNDWVGSRLAGWTPHVRLNDAGRAEAAALAARLVGYPLEAVYASPLERAVETASFVAAPHGLEVGCVDGLGEVRYGEWTGRRLEDLRTEELWATVQIAPGRARFPGGESLAEVQLRAVAAVEELRARHARGAVAAVSHADVIKVVVAHYAGVHLDLFQRLVVDTASVTVLGLTDHGARLVALNDTGRVPLPPADPPPADAPPADAAPADAAPSDEGRDPAGAVDRAAGDAPADVAVHTGAPEAPPHG